MSADKTFYLETFGCQMNVHDSEKVIGTLIHEGYQQVGALLSDAGRLICEHKGRLRSRPSISS